MTNLTLHDLHQMVPAAFATEPASNVSDRYSFIPSEPIIDEVMSRGWLPVEARQSHRVDDKLHATHMITFRQPNCEIEVGGVLPQLTMFNNHAAAKMFKFLGGFFRLVCSNGLIIGTGIAESRIIRIHKDGAEVDIEAAFTEAVGRLDDALQFVYKWQQVPLNFVEQNDFAAKAVLVRNHDDVCWSRHFDAHEFLTRRRDVDKSNDLWTVFNVVQENIMKGGVQGASRTTKPITQVAEIQRINQGLWQLAQDYGTLHGVN